uniref:Oxysterol-binding protein n=1 Tax=Micrurus corallinus TaxID=54390 RepID=A0A2D4FBG1_MICCO
MCIKPEVALEQGGFYLASLPTQVHSWENGRWDEANAEKQRLEEKQRLSRKKREAEAMRATEDGTPYDPYKALWFERKKDPDTKEVSHVYRGGYWESKEKQDWNVCPDIF